MREADYFSLATGGLLLLLLLLRTVARVRVKSLSGAWSFGCVQAGRVFPVILVVRVHSLWGHPRRTLHHNYGESLVNEYSS